MRKFHVNVERSDKTIEELWEDLARAEKRDSTGSVSRDLAYGAADAIILMQDGRVRAALNRAGIEIDDDEPITSEVLLEVVSARLGEKIDSWSAESIREAAFKVLSRKVSDMLGIQVDLTGDLQEQLEKAAIEAILSGRPNRLIDRVTMNRVRNMAAFAQIGISFNERRRILNRWYQKKWRRGKKSVWVPK